MKKSILSFLLALTFASPAAADPLFTVTAQIAIETPDDWEFHTLTGTFFLSEPRMTANLYRTQGPDVENLFEYSLSEFTFDSAILSAGGAGSLWMKQHDVIDRYFRASVDGFTFNPASGSPHVHLSTPLDGTTPLGDFFLGDSFRLVSNSGGPTYRVSRLRATHAVPEPSSLLLLGLGLGGAAVGRALRSRRRPSSPTRVS